MSKGQFNPHLQSHEEEETSSPMKLPPNPTNPTRLKGLDCNKIVLNFQQKILDTTIFGAKIQTFVTLLISDHNTFGIQFSI